ncbi:14714_t:CDS:2 [Cetraspora pellucida]|uniref:14714_t:CDS:1 n=1 Tax=Cetraspora pellucida TaxID=1433469 RepID=A0A9N9A6V4_9GLOM|nr:14714_t:CDS:2 [Cetraspora pellucida]
MSSSGLDHSMSGQSTSLVKRRAVLKMVIAIRYNILYPLNQKHMVSLL